MGGGHVHTSLFIYLIYIWLHRVLVAAYGRSLEVMSGGYSLAVGHGLLIALFLLLQSTGSGTQDSGAVAQRLISCGSWALEHRLSRCGAQALVALWHVESSQIRDQTRVPCTGRWIFIHCATREVPFKHL